MEKAGYEIYHKFGLQDFFYVKKTAVASWARKCKYLSNPTYSQTFFYVKKTSLEQHQQESMWSSIRISTILCWPGIHFDDLEIFKKMMRQYLGHYAYLIKTSGDLPTLWKVFQINIFCDPLDHKCKPPTYFKHFLILSL
jgi:hypothetical protein